MENNRERQSHEDREAQTLVTHIEKQAFHEAARETSQDAREVETKRTFDGYRRKVGSESI